MNDERLPYAINDDGRVIGVLREYGCTGWKRFKVFIPDPAGPDDGWKDDQREAFMRDLDKRAIKEIRRWSRQKYGPQAAVWFIRDQPSTEDIRVVADVHGAMKP